jgi:AcrR family transcriptional regulator
MARSSRDRILAAAHRLVEREGVAHLTIEAVAREAGLSKGGVLYHFPAKESLIAAMVAALLAEWDARIEHALATEHGPGRWVRAYIRACTQQPGGEADPISALLAAIATDPQALEPARRHFALWQRRLADDALSPAAATMVRLAIDGLWFADLFGLAPPTGELRAQVIQTLLRMAEQGSEREQPRRADTEG